LIHRSFVVMVRLDRTIGNPNLVLTGVVEPMVWSSQTMTLWGRP
jgi:hypothetical protein